MQTVFNNSMVAHVWAQQTQSHGRNAGHSLFFDGPTLYSYRRDAPLATIATAPSGVRFAAFTTATYSVTTSQHQSLAWRAWAGRTVTVPDPTVFAEEVTPDHLDVIATDYHERILEALGKASRARRYKSHHLETAANLAEDARWLGANYNQHPGLLAIRVPDDLDAALAEARERDAAEREAREARERERAERAKAEQRGQWEQWRGGNLVGFPWAWSPSNGRQLLTYRPGLDTVATSQGAEFPADHARKAWPRVRLMLACLDEAGRESLGRINKRLEAHPLRLGHFRIDAVTPDGVIVAGCHRVDRAEVERLAGVLGLEPVTA